MGGGHLIAAVSCCSADASMWHAGLVEKGRDWKKLVEHRVTKGPKVTSWRGAGETDTEDNSTCVGGHANRAFHSYFPQECISFSKPKKKLPRSVKD